VNADETDKIFRVRGISGESVAEQQEMLSDYFLTAANQLADPGFILDSQQLQLIPGNSFMHQLWFDPENPIVETVDYSGAFEDYYWLEGWTMLDAAGILVYP